MIKDLVVDRGAFDRIIQAGGYISVNTGAAPEAHSVPVAKPKADRAFEAAKCIGCGACVAACPTQALRCMEPMELERIAAERRQRMALAM